MNKHQIVGLVWVDQHGAELHVTQKSEARGWFNYQNPDGSRGMIRKDGLLANYRRTERVA